MTASLPELATLQSLVGSSTTGYYETRKGLKKIQTSQVWMLFPARRMQRAE
jgi:hypothetical protein